MFVKKLAVYWTSRSHSVDEVHQAQLIQNNEHQGKTMHIINVSQSRIKASNHLYNVDEVLENKNLLHEKAVGPKHMVTSPCLPAYK
jgi:hypothetical protein